MSQTEVYELATTQQDELENEQTASRADEEYSKGLRLIATTVALILSIFLSALDATIIATLIPAITNAFGSLNQIGWYGSAYAMTNAAFLSFWGKAYSYFDLKKTFVVSVSLFELGNLLCGFANSSAMLIAGRAIAGIGGAGNMTGCFIIIACAVKPEQRPLYMGTLGVTFGVASVTGRLTCTELEHTNISRSVVGGTFRGSSILEMGLLVRCSCFHANFADLLSGSTYPLPY